MAIDKKKGFAFSLFALFFSFILFSFSYIILADEDYTKVDSFKKFRVVSIDNELLYFKEVYLQNSLKFSLYNSLDVLLDEAKTSYDPNLNYTRLNGLIKEAMINGTFDSVPQAQMENRTISYFFEEYRDDFEDNYFAQINMSIDEINIFEKEPYYLSLQALVSYNITTVDNISSWNFRENIVVSIPLFDLDEPEFIVQDYQGKDIKIRPAELQFPISSWDLETVNETIANYYTLVFVEPTYHYTIGNSFLKRYLNYSQGSYEDVIGFWSFDHDLDEGELFDSSQNNPDGYYYGNTILLYSFDNNTISGSSVEDRTSYSNDGSFEGVQIFTDCIFDGCIEFDGTDDSLSFDLDSGYFEENFSISFWMKPEPASGLGRIIRHHDAVGFDVYVLDDVLYLSQDETNTISVPYEASQWHQVGVSINDSGAFLYLDGILENQTSRILSNPTRDNIIMGSHNDGSEFYDGLLDEVSIYSRALSSSEMSRIFNQKRALLIDYMDSLYGEGIYFDGVDDFINTTNSTGMPDEFAIEVWFKRDMSSEDGKIYGLVDKRNKGNEWSFFINSGNELIFRGYDGIDDAFLVETDNNTLSIERGVWYHAVAMKNSTDVSLYVNGELQAQSAVLGPLNDFNSELVIGRETGVFDDNRTFHGIIDEVKVYNKTLDAEEIIMNYYNYASIAKGCCNYLTLINPNDLGYDDPAYDENISYSSKVFYDHHFRDIDRSNITIFGPTNLTSDDVSEPYYNLRFDMCVMSAMNIFDFDSDSEIVLGEIGDECYQLIREGIY